MVDIKNYLLDKTNKNNNSLLDQLLYKVLLFKEKSTMIQLSIDNIILVLLIISII